MLEGLLLNLGGDVLAKAVGKRFGAEIGDLSRQALEALGQAFGVDPAEEAIATRIDEVTRTDPDAARGGVSWAQASLANQLLARAEIMRAANEQQRMTNELLQGQLKQPGWRSDWLYAWQWFLMAAWLWTLIVAHIGNAVLRLVGGAGTPLLPVPDMGVLLTLTGLYLGLHMGGHTVLELMRGGAVSKGGR